MGMTDRLTLVRLHALLAVFICPAVMMFLVTGALYTWGIKGGYDTQQYEINLEAPLSSRLSALVLMAEQELQKRDKALPTGKAKVKKAGTSFKFEWTGSVMDIVIEPTSDPLIAIMSIKKASWYRHLVQLHKAKSGYLFKIYAAIMSMSLLLLFVTGGIMAWQLPKLRRSALVSAAAGTGLFIVMVVCG